MNVLAIYGSLNLDSINKALIKTLAELAPADMPVEILGVDGFPLFSKELEAKSTPEIVADYKAKILAADGIIISTPEYNRSLPGSLKNALDWISRGEQPWKGKPVGVVGASDGVRGASFAQYDLKRILTYLDARVLGQPELYLGEADEKIANGLIRDEKARGYIVKYLEKFKTHIESCKKQ